MRDPARIKPFCDRLAYLWETNCPDWRFGQLIENVYGSSRYPIIPFFYCEENEMLRLFDEYFCSKEEIQSTAYDKIKKGLE